MSKVPCQPWLYSKSCLSGYLYGEGVDDEIYLEISEHDDFTVALEDTKNLSAFGEVVGTGLHFNVDGAGGDVLGVRR